jgi:hypothetical protein
MPGIGPLAPARHENSENNSPAAKTNFKDALYAAFDQAIAGTKEVAPGLRIPNASQPPSLDSLIRTIA